MNDICSPMVILIENEADAFWCFERAMRRLVRLLFPLKNAHHIMHECGADISMSLFVLT